MSRTDAFVAEAKRQSDWEEPEFWAYCAFCHQNVGVDPTDQIRPKFVEHSALYPAGSTFEHKQYYPAPLCEKGSGRPVPVELIKWNEKTT